MNLLQFKPREPLKCQAQLNYLRLRLTPWQRWAFRKLEAKGYRYLVDFGTANAVRFLLTGKRI